MRIVKKKKNIQRSNLALSPQEAFKKINKLHHANLTYKGR